MGIIEILGLAHVPNGFCDRAGDVFWLSRFA